MIDLEHFISIDPEIRFGNACIRETRISVGDILSWLAAGMSHCEILADYPLLCEDDIIAALTFAANKESIFMISAS